MAKKGLSIHTRIIITPLFWVGFALRKMQLLLLVRRGNGRFFNIELSPVVKSFQYKDRLFVLATWINIAVQIK